MFVYVHPTNHTGYEMFGLMRCDRALSFRDLCGEEPQATSKKKKAALVRAVALAARTSGGDGGEMEDEDSEGSVSEDDSEGVDVVATPTGVRATRSTRMGAPAESPANLGKQTLV